MCGSGSIETTLAWQAPYLPMVEGAARSERQTQSTFTVCTSTSAVFHVRRRTSGEFQTQASEFETQQSQMYYLYLEKYEPAAYCALTGETVARAIRRRLERGRTAAADSLSASSSSEDDSRAHEDQDVQPDVVYEQYHTT